LRIVLEYQSSIPIYEQIKEQIKESVLNGLLPENELLPSIRRLAAELRVSVITTTRAYNDLEAEGYIVTVPGKGCYIKKIDSAFARLKYLGETKAALKNAVKFGKTAGLSLPEIHELLDEAEEGYVK